MKRFAALLLFVLVSVLPSVAQNRGAIIIRAEYGGGNSWADVTQRVRSLVQGNTLNFRVDNATLRTDPWPGQRKILRMEVREGNRTQQLMFRENDSVRLRGYSPFGDLEILRGSYGAGNRGMDVTRRLNAQVQGDQLRLRVSNETMGGDPARNQRKALTVQYRYDGRPNQVKVYEGDFLNLPGGGNNGGGNNRGLLISRAQYGIGNRMADVTNALNAQIQRGQLRLQVSNQALGGDPAPNQVKTLTVWYTNDGRPSQVTIKEGDYLTLPDSNSGGGYGGGYGGGGGNDNRGGYGGGDNDNRGGYGGGNNADNRGLQVTRAQYGAGNRLADVTRSLDSQVQRGQLNLQVTNQTMGGDPAPNQPKVLTVWYTIDGRPDQVMVNEGGTLNLPQRRPN